MKTKSQENEDFDIILLLKIEEKIIKEECTTFDL